MNLKKRLLSISTSFLVFIFPIAVAFLAFADPAMAIPPTSDRNIKDNIADVDVDEVLATLL